MCIVLKNNKGAFTLGENELQAEIKTVPFRWVFWDLQSAIHIE